jgi:aminoglycoside/choline kinase family phosphotransferase
VKWVEANVQAYLHYPLTQPCTDARWKPAILSALQDQGTNPRVAALIPAHRWRATLLHAVNRYLMLSRDGKQLQLYRSFGEALAALHEAPPPPGLPAWDAAAMARATAATFLDWWWPAAMGAAPSDDLRAGLAAALHAMLSPFAGTRGFVHRDYFPANLMRLDRRAGAQRTGLLDFQDAGLGHPAYDLVSLIEDARRDVAPEARDAALARYFAARPGVARDDFTAAMAACAAQRHLRVAALWVRLAQRDHKPRYLIHGPRCWRLLHQALEHPATAPLRLWLDDALPRQLRRNPDAVMEPR